MFYTWFYRPITEILSPIGIFVLWVLQLLASKGTKELWKQRRGIYRNMLLPSRPRVWIHAASVGEMTAAEAIVPQLQEIYPNCETIVTTMTFTGHKYAQKNLNIPSYMLPLDFPWTVKRAIQTISPTVLVLLETEIWPNLIACAHHHKIPVCLINGRISQRASGGFFAKRLYKPILSLFVKFSMINEQNKNRILALGASPHRIVVHSNAKLDTLLNRVAACKKVTFLDPLVSHVSGKHVLVAGSIRHGEFSQLIKAAVQIYEKDPNAVFIFAPRHLKRVQELVDQLQIAGFQVELYSNASIAQKKVVAWVLDTIGDLFSIYQHVTVAFCGSSLVKLGGQNIFEPVAWKKPVLSGPSLEDFELARDLLLRYEGLKIVYDEQDLANTVIKLFQDSEKRQQMGDQAFRALETVLGGAKKHAKEITPYLP